MTKESPQLTPWAEPDLPVLRRLNAPEMTEHLGGPETDEQVENRNRRYVAMTDPKVGQMYVVRVDGEPVGSIGYWEREWQGQMVYEIGWGVLPEFQGRGLAVAAGQAMLEFMRELRHHRFAHAYPSVTNGASNAICRRLGLTLHGEIEFEYPPGHPMRCNDWFTDLTEPAAGGGRGQEPKET